MNTEFILFFDGCSKGNPGEAGAGAVLYSDNQELWSDSIFVGNKETNNKAEYSGLILGMREAIKRNIKDIIIKGDSQLVIRHMLGRYKVKSDNLIPLYKEAKELEKQFNRVKYIHVYRTENKKADELSNEGLLKKL